MIDLPRTIFSSQGTRDSCKPRVASLCGRSPSAFRRVAHRFGASRGDLSPVGDRRQITRCEVLPTRNEPNKRWTGYRCQPRAYARVVLVCFRDSNLKNLGGLWLAPTPSVLGFPRTLGSSALRPPDEVEFSSPGRSSLALRRHLSVLASRGPPSYGASHADHDPPSEGTSL
jgi:hypothetical protein